jgi:threonine/homoserine/homoserine lactone efflux protein
MVSTSRLLEFVAIAAVLIAIPGPSVLFTVGRALTAGRKTALYTVAGNEIGLCVQVAAVAFGVGAVVQRSAQVFTILKWCGAAYLVYLGVQAIRHRRAMSEVLASQAPPVRPLRALRDGFIVGVTNPKTIVFLLVALPGFVSNGPGYLPVPAQMLLIGILFPAMALIMDSIWALAAGLVRHWLARSPRRMALLGGTGGLAMIALGITVAATGRKD